MGEERPLVDILDDVLMVGQPRPRATDVAVDAPGEQDGSWVDGVTAEPSNGMTLPRASATAAL
jgi:hypothetical protein